MFCLHNPKSSDIIDSWTSCSLSLSNIHNRKDRGKPFRVYVTEQFVQSVHMTAQDRRITKTRKAIYNAFLHLLNQKDYEAITVQEIIDLADVGRSTFYSHYESKELLLDELCQKLFHHLFERAEHLSPQDYLAHIFQHFKKNQDHVTSLLLSKKRLFYPSATKRTRTRCLPNGSRRTYQVPSNHPSLLPQTPGRQPFHRNPQLVVEKRQVLHGTRSDPVLFGDFKSGY